MAANSSVSDTYICSIIDFSLIPVKNNQECNLTLMVTTELNPRYVFRYTKPNGLDVVHENASNFKYADALINLCTIRKMFYLRAVLSEPRSSINQLNVPYSIRIFVSEDGLKNFASAPSSKLALENETALVSLLTAARGNIVIEPACVYSSMDENNLPNQTNFPRGLPICPAFKRSQIKFYVTPRKNLASEQRNFFQTFLENSFAQKSFAIDSNLKFGGNLCLDGIKGTIDFEDPPSQKQSEGLWKPSCGIVQFTRGCGRRRAIAASLAYIARTNFEEDKIGKRKSINHFNAPKVSLVICDFKEIDHWEKELRAAIYSSTVSIFGADEKKDDKREQSVIKIAAKEDFNQLTYECCQKGAVLLLNSELLVHLQAIKLDAIEKIHDLVNESQPYARKIDDSRCIRIHVDSLSERIPQSCVPLLFLNLKLVYAEPPLNVNAENLGQDKEIVLESDLLKIEKFQKFIKHLSSIKSEFMWLGLGYEGEPSRVVPLKLLEMISPLLKLEFQLSRWGQMGNSFIGGDQLAPDIWRLYHEFNSGLILKIPYPKAILKMAAPIPVPCVTSPDEKKFVSLILSGTHSKFSLYTQNYHYMSTLTTDCLLGAENFGIKGSHLNLVLKRCAPLSLKDSIGNLDSHFLHALEEGTLAQKLEAYLNAKENILNAKQVQSSKKQYVIDNIKLLNKQVSNQDNQAEKITCAICDDEDVNNMALCGHYFCTGCKTELINRFNHQKHHNVELKYLSCSVCRAHLSEFDWITLQKNSDESILTTSSLTNSKPSKIQSLEATVSSLFSKRRHKKRGGITVWLVCPSEISKKALKSQIECGDFKFSSGVIVRYFDDRFATNYSPEGQSIPFTSNRLELMSVSDFSFACKNNLDDNVEAVLMASPMGQNSSIYYQVLRECSRWRSTPLQLYVFFSKSFENPTEDVNVFK